MLAPSSEPPSRGRVWVRVSLRTFAHSSRPLGVHGQLSPVSHSHATVPTPALRMQLAVIHLVRFFKRLREASGNFAVSQLALQVFRIIAGVSEPSASDTYSRLTAPSTSSIVAST